LNTTTAAAIELVTRTADSQTCLDANLRDALRVVARAARNQGESAEVAALKNLLHHAWIHSAYSDNGYDKMTQEERALYNALKSEWSLAAG